MANYDITMKQYNGSGYDSLYPKDIGQQVLLNDSSLRTLLGIAATNPTLNDAIAQLNTNAVNSIEMGSYAGTGNFSATLNFSFNPRFVLIMGWGGHLVFIKDAPVCVISPLNTFSRNDIGTVTWANNKITWECDSDYGALNESSKTYYYIAFK